MVMVALKGINVVRKKLADGTFSEHHYAWRGKGAPKLPGAPGSPEYLRAYEQAHAPKAPTEDNLSRMIRDYRASAAYKKLGAHSVRAYDRYLDSLDAELGSLPRAALNDPKVRRHLLRWRDTMADTPRTADYAMSVVKRMFSWAVEYTLLDANQAEPIGRLHSVDKSDSIWSPEELAKWAEHASDELRWAIGLALHTGLRQGDVVRLTWSSYDGRSFAWRTSKRKKEVLIPATAACRALVAEIGKRSPIILTTERGKRPWTTDGLRSSFNAARKAAGVTKTFHDLRRTAATYLLSAGLEASIVAMIMGWSEDAIEVLKRKYVSRGAVVEAALAKLEKGG